MNAETDPDYGLDLSDFVPSILLVLGVTTGIQIKHFNFETIELVQGSFENWASELSKRSGRSSSGWPR